MTGERSSEASVQRQARALADPTRYRIFRHIVESPEPPRVATISRRFGLSDSGVRQHLGKLCEAGLVVEEQVAQHTPGRPPLQYRLATATAGAWRTPGPYEELALLFLELLRNGSSPREVGAAAGRLIPRPPSPTFDALDHLEAEMGRRGFEPHRVERGDSIDLVLGRCPFEAAAVADPGVVCGLHLGMAEGIAEAGGSEVEITGLVLSDPRQAGCRLQVRRTPPA